MNTLHGSPGLGSINFLTGSLAGSTVQLHKSTVTIGREPGNDIVVTDPSVSRHHATITLNGGTWLISNLTQRNIVTINQRDVPPLQQSSISERDTITLGTETTFLFLPKAGVSPSSQPAAPPQQPFQNAPPPLISPSFVAQQPVPPYNPAVGAPPLPPTGSLAREQQYQPAQAGAQRAAAGVYAAASSGTERNAPLGTPSLEVSSNISQDRPHYPLTAQVTNIGRHPTNDIVIKEPVVSAFHAQIVREGDRLIFIHPHSRQQRTTNGILYQGRPGHL